MSILGVIIFCIILFCYSFILLSDTISKSIASILGKQEIPNKFLVDLQQILQKTQEDPLRQHLGYGAFVLALWNFFAPDFGYIYGGITLLGALIPVIVLFFDAFILAPQLLDWVPISSVREKMVSILERISPLAGWLTLLVSVLHVILYPFPFF